MSIVRVRPGRGPLRGDVSVPGDKSIGHRAVLLGALADGTQHIEGLPGGADVRSSMAAVAALGADVEERGGVVWVHGAGTDFGTRGASTVDCGNSGTTMRLLAGMLAGGTRTVVLDGDESLRRRPMERVAEPLRAMGGSLVTTEGRPPVRIEPRALHGVDWTMAVASAQVKSAVLLAGLRAAGTTVVRESVPTRDHTERMFAAMGVQLTHPGGGVAVAGGQRLRATRVVLPGDPSSAAFFVVAATLVDGSSLVLPRVCVNPHRTGFLAVLRRMGAAITAHDEATCAGEPVADLRVTGGALQGTTIHPNEVPASVDELPILAIAAALATGETRLRGAGELRVKESDRLAALGQLAALGVAVEVLPDGLIVQGTPRARLRGARVSAHGDHRIAMAFAIAGLAVPDGVEIAGAEAVDVSYPGFFERLEALGARVEQVAG